MRIGAPHAGLKSGPIESGRVWSIDEIVDTDRYPLDPIDTTQLRHFRQEFIQHGICRLPGFIRSAAVADIVAESDATVPGTYRQDVRGNAYLTAAPPTDASGSGQIAGGVVDPRAIESRSALCALPYDQFDPSRAAATLYGDDRMLAFVQHILGVEDLHRYADPLGAFNVADMDLGDELGWHFDMADFVVSIGLRTAGGGGDFEVVQDLRTRDDERYSDVWTVLKGDRTRVVAHPIEPGTLMVFCGRYSLHRVTPIIERPSRLVALLAYDTKPGVTGSASLTRTRYGR